MDSIFLGKIVGTHGIKGEIRIISDFERKDLAFNVGNELIINRKNYIIESYRRHKNYDMVTFKGYTNINDVIFLKGSNAFIDKKYFADVFLMNDYVGLTVSCNNKEYGTVVDYQNGLNPLLKVKYLNKSYYIPINGNFIDEVKEDKLITKNIEELII